MISPFHFPYFASSAALGSTTSTIACVCPLLHPNQASQGHIQSYSKPGTYTELQLARDIYRVTASQGHIQSYS